MFHGTLPAIVTPMKEQGRLIDYSSLERLVTWYLKNVDGLVLLGTTGESPTLRPEERKAIISQVVSQVNSKVPVIVGTGVNSTETTIQLTRQAMELGADAALLITPYYNKPTQQGLYEHYRAVAKAVPIPQILYNVPGRTACDLLPKTVQRLSQFSNIVGIKEATGSLARLKCLLELECGIDILTGVDANTIEFMKAGGRGAISVVANVVPDQVSSMINALLQHQVVKDSCVSQFKALNECLFVETNPIPLKWMLSQMGLISADIRLPLTVLSRKYHAKLRSVIDQFGIAIGSV